MVRVATKWCTTILLEDRQALIVPLNIFFDSTPQNGEGERIYVVPLYCCLWGRGRGAVTTYAFWILSTANLGKGSVHTGIGGIKPGLLAHCA